MDIENGRCPSSGAALPVQEDPSPQAVSAHGAAAANAGLIARANEMAVDIEEVDYASPALQGAFVRLCYDGVAPELVPFDPDLWQVRYGDFAEPDTCGRLMAAYLRLWVRWQTQLQSTAALQAEVAFKAYELSMAELRASEWECCAKFEHRIHDDGSCTTEFKGWDWARLDECRHRYLTKPNGQHEGTA
jgi:hypothetical protein